MAELAASAFAAMSSAFTGTAATAATSTSSWLAGTTVSTAGGLTASLAPTSTALSALQGAATIASMASTLVGGGMAYAQSREQARFAALDAEGARLEGEEKALRIRRETVQKIGAARVAYAGSGLDISGAGAIEDSLQNESQFEQGLAMTAADYARARGLAAASQIRERGTSSLIGAAAKAFGTKLDYKISLARRG